MPVLPPDDRVLAQVANVGNTGPAAGLDQHPADMGVEETLVCIVRVEVGVGVAMVGAVTTAPPLDGALHSAGTCHGEKILEGERRVIRPVGPKSVVARGDTQSGHEIVEHGEEEGLPAKRREHGANEADDGGGGEDDDAQPVQLIAEVLPRERREGLLGGECVLDIVVRDVEVGGYLLSDILCGTLWRGARRGGHGGGFVDGGRRGSRRRGVKEGRWREKMRDVGCGIYALNIISLGIPP